jgi:hypothetical protein
MAIGGMAGFARIAARATVGPHCWHCEDLLQLMYLRCLSSSFLEENSHVVQLYMQSGVGTSQFKFVSAFTRSELRLYKVWDYERLNDRGC